MKTNIQIKRNKSMKITTNKYKLYKKNLEKRYKYKLIFDIDSGECISAIERNFTIHNNPYDLMLLTYEKKDYRYISINNDRVGYII